MYLHTDRLPLVYCSWGQSLCTTCSCIPHTSPAQCLAYSILSVHSELNKSSKSQIWRKEYFESWLSVQSKNQLFLFFFPRFVPWRQWPKPISSLPRVPQINLSPSLWASWQAVLHSGLLSRHCLSSILQDSLVIFPTKPKLMNFNSNEVSLCLSSNEKKYLQFTHTILSLNFYI